MDERLSTVSRALDYAFRRPQLLAEALTHPSAAARSGAFERLEFLGDRVLGLAVADMLYRRFPAESEGDLARRHAALVRRETLGRVAAALALDAALLVARSDEGGGPAASPAMLADACEAVLGAVYVDAGFAPAFRIVRRLWQPLVAEAAAPPRDAKTALQEWAQARGRPLPIYATLGQDGPPHDPSFLVSVTVAGEAAEQGRGASKRAAEQAAAATLLARLPP